MPEDMFPEDMFDDLSLPITFNIEENDISFSNIFGYGDNLTVALALVDEYSAMFDDLDINVFVSYENQSVITFNDNLPLVTDTLPESE